MNTKIKKKQIIENLKNAIEIMKAACEDAERDLEMDERDWDEEDLENLPQAVFDDFSWAFKEASLKIKNAKNLVD